MCGVESATMCGECDGGGEELCVSGSRCCLQRLDELDNDDEEIGDDDSESESRGPDKDYAAHGFRGIRDIQRRADTEDDPLSESRDPWSRASSSRTGISHHQLRNPSARQRFSAAPNLKKCPLPLIRKV